MNYELQLAQIVEGCVNGKQQARKDLYNLFAAKMLSVCHRYMSNKTDAEDIFQEGFLKVFENIVQLRQIERLEWWMKKIFINEALQLYHKKKKIDFIDDEYKLNSRYDDFNVFSKFHTDEITNIIQNLPEKMRLVFNMFAIEGYPHNEIAEKLGISVGTSKSNLHDARKLLQEKMMNLEIEKRKLSI